MDGLIAGNGRQVVVQAIGIVGALVYSAVASFVLLKVIGLFATLRVNDNAEGVGLDMAAHGEEAYVDGEGAILVPPRPDATAPAARPLGGARTAGGAA